jgi:hypothetical protein
MVCYARPAGRFAALLIVALLVFGRPVSHFFDTAAFMAVAAVVTGGAAVAAALVFAAFMSTRRRRAAAGGCVSCQFRCQHAMTERGGRMWLVTTVDRRETAPAQPGSGPAAPGSRPAPPAPGSRPAPVFLPMPSVASAAPRWPDRPAHRQSPARQSPARQSPAWQSPAWQSPAWQSPSVQLSPAQRRERAGSPA